MENQAARRYLARIKRALVCDRNNRRRLLARCTVMIDDFQQENPGAGYDGLVAAFGEPGAFAAELLSGLGEANVKAARKRRRFTYLSMAAVVIALLVGLSVFWHAKYEREARLPVPVIKVPEGITLEEFEEIWENTPEEARGELWKDLQEDTP